LSPFRFHFWQEIEYYDATLKQPEDGWKPGRFLGVDWDSGDALTYFVETDKGPRDGRNVILTRSTIRPHQPANMTSPVPASGENTLTNPVSGETSPTQSRSGKLGLLEDGVETGQD